MYEQCSQFLLKLVSTLNNFHKKNVFNYDKKKVIHKFKVHTKMIIATVKLPVTKNYLCEILH